MTTAIDIIERGTNILNKSFEFYTISKKNIGYRKKIRLLRLVNLFPQINKTIKAYNNIQSTSYKDFMSSIIKKKDDVSNKNYTTDKHIITKMMTDFKNIYDTYSNTDTQSSNKQVGGAQQDGVLSAGDGLLGSATEASESMTEGSDVGATDAVAMSSEQKERQVTLITRIKKQCESQTDPFNIPPNIEDLYTIITDPENANGYQDIYKLYDFSEKLRDSFQTIFPPDETYGDYISVSNSVSRAANMVKILDEYKSIIKPIMDNFIKLKREGVNNPFLIVIETIQVLVASIIGLKNTVSEVVDSVKFIINTVALIGMGAGTATGAGAPFVGSGAGTAAVHEVMGIVGILRIMSDLFAPYVIFFTLIAMDQDELAADTLITYHPLFLELPINILYGIISPLSEVINMNNLHKVGKLVSDPSQESDLGQILDTIYSDLTGNSDVETGKKIVINIDNIRACKVLRLFKTYARNSIICQLIELFEFEGTCIILNLNFHELYTTVYNAIERLIKNIQNGYDISQSSATINIARLVIGLDGAKKIEKLISSPATLLDTSTSKKTTILEIAMDNLRDLWKGLKPGGVTSLLFPSSSNSTSKKCIHCGDIH